MLKKIGRKPRVLRALGGLFAAYVRFLHRTTRWTSEPLDARSALGGEPPVILSLWHGQHVFASLGWPPDWPVSVLVARHADGEINALALERLGAKLIRGSGAHGHADNIRRRGGVQALRKLIGTLKAGESVALTADVPKIGGVVGEGIVLLAKLSGRPIYPLAVVTRRRIQFSSWDSATLGLPFGRGAIVYGEPLTVPRDADDEALETARIEVGRRLDQVHARAYELAGGKPWRSRDG